MVDEETPLMDNVLEDIQKRQEQMQERQKQMQERQEQMQKDHDSRNRTTLVIAVGVFTLILGTVFVIGGNPSFQDQAEQFIGEYWMWILFTLGGGGMMAWLRESFKNMDTKFERMDAKMDTLMGLVVQQNHRS